MNKAEAVKFHTSIQTTLHKLAETTAMGTMSFGDFCLNGHQLGQSHKKLVPLVAIFGAGKISPYSCLHNKNVEI
jgi:plasmid stabilization system protein ParE